MLYQRGSLGKIGLALIVSLLAVLGTLRVLSQSVARPEGPAVLIAGDDGFSRVNPAVGMNERGRYVVAWDGRGTGDLDGVFVRVYDERGVARSLELRANTTTAKIQSSPRAAMDDAGNFIVVWQSQDQDGSGYGIYARVFDRVGNPKTAEIPVNQTTAADQSAADVASLRDGRFVVVWQSATGTSSSAVLARWYSPDGVARTAEVSVASSGQNPAVTTDAAGTATVSWRTTPVFGYFVRRFDSNGSALDNAFPAGWPGPQPEPGDVAANGDGAYVAVGIGYDGISENFNVWTSRFTAPGDATTGATAPAWSDTQIVNHPIVALDARGGYLVSWAGSTSARFRRFQPDGTVKNSSFDCIVDFCVPPKARNAAIGMSARGDYTFAIERSTQDAPPGPSSILARRFCADLSGTNPLGRTACVGGSAFFSTTATGRMPVKYQWRKGGVALVDDSRVRGARTATLVLDPVQAGDAGSYDCVISDACSDGATVTTLAATLSVGTGTPPGAVTGLRITKMMGGQIRLNWNDVSGATDYVVYDDLFPDTGFVHEVGTATSGVIGLTLTPPKDHRQYRVAARNPSCGVARPD